MNGNRYQKIYNLLAKVLQVCIVLACMTGPVLAQSSLQEETSQVIASATGLYGNMEVNRDVTNSAVLNKIISLEIKNATLYEALREIAQQAGLKLSYDTQNVQLGQKITVSQKYITVNKAIWKVLEGTGLRYAVSPNGNLILMGMLEEQMQALETVSGQVTDSESGESLPGVNVVIKGTATGTATNAEGEFQLGVPSLQDTLMFSFVGYITQEVPINGRTTINVEMQTQAIAGEELVVTGYSSQRAADITGAVSTVSIEDMNKETSANVLSKLKGKVPGVTVTTSGSPGSYNTVRIRGVSSFQNNDPLYVIDGVPVQDAYTNWLNPNDIESMQVLKEASAASIYGARANNGVVIITTKKGNAGAGAPQVSVNMNVGVATPVNGYDDIVIQDPMQYYEVMKRSYMSQYPGDAWKDEIPRNIYGDPDSPSIPAYIWPNDGTTQTQASDVNEDNYLYPDNLIMPANGAGTDWWDAVFDPALVQDFNLSVSGGNETARYNVSFNYFDQEGTMKYNWYKRGSVRVNTEFDAGIMTFGENISLTLAENVGGMPAAGGYVENTSVGKNVLMQPVVPVYDVNGYFASGKAVSLGNQSNPVKIAWDNRDDITSNNRLVGNVFGQADFTESISFKTSLGFDVGESKDENFGYPTPENSEPTMVTSFNEGRDRFTNWTWTNTLQYVTTLGENHNINALVGTEAIKNNYRGIDGSMAGYITTDVDARYINDALGDPGTKNVSSFGSVSSLLSFFGKVDYNYDSKYLLSLTLRRDGSSRLGPDHQWGTFPAASIGWRLSEEAFLQDADILDDLKIRAGFGITGNQQIPSGRTVDLFGGSTGTTFYDISGSNNSVATGYRRTAIGNPDLKWEQNVSYNIGLDAEFMQGRLSFVVDVYQREVNDLLFNPTIPGTQGNASAPFVNIGKMQNRGIDFNIGYRGSIGNDLTWNVDLNGSHYQNEIVRIDGTSDFFFGPVSGRGGETSINHLGYAIGSFYGLVADGIFQNWDEVDAHVDQEGAAPGRLRFKDVNGDGTINGEDQDIIGSYHPDFTGGINLGMQWKNFDFSAFLFASIGNDIFNVQKEFTIFRLFNTNVRKDRLTKSAVLNTGSPFMIEGGETVRNPEAEVTNPNAEYPALDQSDTFSSEFSSFYVEDGSYMRLQNLQIGYTVPVGTLPAFRNLRVYLQAENLFTITGYSNIDPALPASVENANGVNLNDQSQGVDRGTYPSNRIFSIGLQADF